LTNTLAIIVAVFCSSGNKYRISTFRVLFYKFKCYFD